MTKPQTDTRIVFLDLETSGLDPSNDIPLEVGVLVVDAALNPVVAESGVSNEFEEMITHPGGYPLRHLVPNKFVLNMHQQSGLCAEYDHRASRGEMWGLTTVEMKCVQFLEKHHGFQPGTVTLAGFCPQFDMAFLKKHMPILARMFDYRHVDVSTIRGLVRRWVDADADNLMSKLAQNPVDAKHRALADCHAALRELTVYRTHLFDVDGFSKLREPTDVRTALGAPV